MLSSLRLGKEIVLHDAISGIHKAHNSKLLNSTHQKSSTDV